MEQQHQRQPDRISANETVPREIAEPVLALCEDLEIQPPLHLNVSPGPAARMGWCSANVLAQCDEAGGEPVYGWLIWEAPGLYLNAEFHCVWHDGRRLLDITPTQEGEDRVLFSPDPGYGADFDFRHRPHNRRFRSYAWLKNKPSVNAVLEGAKDKAVASVKQTAKKYNVTLRQIILASLPRDETETAIDEFLFASGELERIVTVTDRGSECLPPYSVAQYHSGAAEVDLLRRRMLRLAILAEASK